MIVYWFYLRLMIYASFRKLVFVRRVTISIQPYLLHLGQEFLLLVFFLVDYSYYGLVHKIDWGTTESMLLGVYGLDSKILNLLLPLSKFSIVLLKSPFLNA